MTVRAETEVSQGGICPPSHLLNPLAEVDPFFDLDAADPLQTSRGVFLAVAIGGGAWLLLLFLLWS
jgi:hypothetical protein